MREPLQDQRAPRTIEKVQSFTLPAPTRGWNTKANIAEMPMGFAITLENVIPREEKCQLRAGAANHVTGFTAGKVIETLAAYQPASGSGKLFAATDQGVFDVTTPGVVGATVSAGTNGRWQWVNFANSATSWLVMVNGVDNCKTFDGTTWTTPATFGVVNTNSLVDVEVYRQRLFFAQISSRQLYYLAAGAVTGAATASSINLEQLLKQGGYLQAVKTWTVDAGSGANDLLCCISSEGEVVVFQGTDPSNVATWSHVGTYTIGRPIGRRCTVKFGGDLLIITERGVFPMSKVIQSSTIDPTVAITYNIEEAVRQQSASYRTTFGWQIEAVPAQRVLVMNIPSTPKVQYVQHYSGSWCKFTGWDIASMCYFNGDLYFGATAKVAKAFSGTSDFGGNITGVIEPAYTDFGVPARLKNVTLLRPMFDTTGPFSFTLGMNTDFLRTTSFSIVSASAFTQSLWDTAVWDAGSWTADTFLTQEWHSVGTVPGFWHSPYIGITTTSVQAAFTAMIVHYKLGGLI